MRHQSNHVFAVAVIAAAAFAPGLAADSATISDPATAGFAADRLIRIDKSLQGYVERNEVPGVVGLIARRGQIVYHKSFGHRDVEAKVPMSNDAIFRIASMTKPIASAALMMLWEEGRFLLRDPVAEYLPEFADMKVAVPVAPGDSARGPYRTVAAKNAITIQHLLTHTAGLANPYRGVTRELYDQLRQNRKPNGTVGDYVAELARLPLNFEPGERWEYGPATDVVGRLVEVLSGMTLDQYLRTFAKTS